MKTPESARREGAALVIVLGFLVLLAVMVVGFFAAVKVESRTVRNSASASEAKTIADSATQIAMANLREATTPPAGQAWAAQPGMIRTYDESGSPEKVFKLYSSANRVEEVSSGGFPSSSDLPGAGWSNDPAIWADLNAPGRNSAGEPVFPVVDPRAEFLAEGFAIDAAALDGARVAANPNDESARAPMPVRWIYLLKDGRTIVPTGGSGDIATFAGAAAQPSAANPIVGRFAYWMDDETAKLNINTASAPTRWDIPKFRSQQDYNYAERQPAQNEFQAYPGHPATVSLRPAFPDLTDEEILNLVPRYRFGGTEGGTKEADAVIDVKSERMFATTAESRYEPDRAATPGNDEIARKEFFLTASSRAPETNLFGQPRISIWPVAASDANRTALDRLFVRCATLGGEEYFFQRSRSTDDSTDINLPRNRALLDWLDTQTGKQIPGFGGSFRTKFGQPETRQILTQIFDYVRATNIQDPTLDLPGGQTRFADPVPASVDDRGDGQVIASHHPDWDTLGFGRVAMLSQVSIHFLCIARGANSVTGASAEKPDALGGAGPPDPPWPPVLPTDLSLTANDQLPNDTVGVVALIHFSFFDAGMSYLNLRDNLTVRVRDLDQLQLNGLDMGFPAEEWVALGMRGGQTGTAGNDLGYSPNNAMGGPRDLRYALVARVNPDAAVKKIGSRSDQRFPFFSRMVALRLADIAGGTMNFTGAPITVELIAGPESPQTITSDDGSVVQTYTVDLGMIGPQLPVPEFRSETLSAVISRAYSNSQLRSIFAPEHVVRSLVVAGGDSRLMARRNVGTDRFEPHRDNADTAIRLAHSHFHNVEQEGRVFFGGTKGRLVATQEPPTATFNNRPYVPANVDIALTESGAPGDWDNGVGMTLDGPMINRAEQGAPPEIGAGLMPYFTKNVYGALFGANPDYFLFSPNRQVPSPLMLGSLPTGVVRGRPWQTLLFRPGPTDHPGAESPPDHLLADLFWMPVVEPYAISEPLSTAGKINLNYEIAPFTHIERSTAIRGLLESEQVARVRLADQTNYKWITNQANPQQIPDPRLPLNLSETNGTLRQFRERFESGDIFRSATEICDIFLVPEGYSWPTDAAARSGWYGNDFALVGDNTRERPYANVYGRVTTKSNTFKIHVLAQSLQKVPGTSASQWDESRDQITAEYQGSALIERYIDADNPDLPNFATTPDATLDAYYNLRTFGEQRFLP